MKLSVMVTCYNCVEYIDKAIASVVNQYLPFSWELLVGDDGSTDGTLEKAYAWSARYSENIFVYENEIERDQVGLSGFRAAYNRARLLERARGKYLAFLDGDDWLLGREKFALQISLLEDPSFGDCSCAAHRTRALGSLSDGEVYLPPQDLPSGIIDPVRYWSSYYFHTNTIVFRRECSHAMLEEKYKGFLNDNFITFLLIQNGPILYLNDVFAVYNKTGTGLWTGKSRAYGLLRNVALFDLECEVNPTFEKASMCRHFRDFVGLSSQFAEEEQAVIDLMAQHDKDRFRSMWAFYRGKKNRGCASLGFKLVSQAFVSKMAHKVIYR